MKKADVSPKRKETQLDLKETNESRLAIVLAFIFLTILAYYVIMG
jgi:hypothetical protein